MMIVTVVAVLGLAVSNILAAMSIANMVHSWDVTMQFWDF
jgi:hypothetical protein